ncbi:MAG: hypothetical protein B6240_01695 [Desulfobacteraceae bacterium 4572_87]|nr:MAG: hypothetical protein B6240_01695 [Desulfobacteraceae bacterium 4572_87]
MSEFMMVRKIVSGGQTGADRAALDFALEWNLSHGGWIPKGRRAEDGILPQKYRLKEMNSTDYARRTEQNVIDSDATLIFSHGKLTGGSLLTQKMALKHGRPKLHMDLLKTNSISAPQSIHAWIKNQSIGVLNVAGPRQSQDKRIYRATFNILEAAFQLSMNRTHMNPSIERPYPLPKNVDEAVERLLRQLTLKDKSKMARMNKRDLKTLNHTLGRYIADHFGLREENDALISSCGFILRKGTIKEAEAISLIIMKLWEKLQSSHGLRIVS